MGWKIRIANQFSTWVHNSQSSLKIDFKLPCVCSVIDHRVLQNVVEQKRGTRGAAECVTDFPNCH